PVSATMSEPPRARATLSTHHSSLTSPFKMGGSPELCSLGKARAKLNIQSPRVVSGESGRSGGGGLTTLKTAARQIVGQRGLAPPPTLSLPRYRIGGRVAKTPSEA